MIKMFEIPIEDIEYDKETNRIIINFQGKKLAISVTALRTQYLSILNEKEKVQELAMMHHDINKEKLARIANFMDKMIEIDDEMEDAYLKLKTCTSAICVRKWDAVLAASTKRKNVLKEIRYSIGLLERQKKPLRTRIAKLGFDATELTGENI